MVILASQSPRRKELLRLLVPDFLVEVSQADEAADWSMGPRQAVEELALRKARAVAARHPRDTVIGADTVVVLDGRVLGKPADPEDAARMLRALSGRRHQVCTGAAVVSPAGERSLVSVTQVEMYPLSPEEIRWYVATGEPMDKAGAYGIQGKGCRLVRGIQGDYFTVVGLPVAALARMLPPSLLG